MKVPRDRIVSMNGDVFGHFLLSAITVIRMEKQVEVPNPDEYDVTLTLNGVELPVEEVSMAWHNELDNSVEHRAKQLFAEKIQDVRNIFSDLAQDLDTEMETAKEKICNKLNLWGD
jgi:hypothetical protein